MTNVPWPRERVGQLRALASDRMSSRAIAKVMGITRNMVIGECRRKGIALTGPPKWFSAENQPPRKSPRKPPPPKPWQCTVINIGGAPQIARGLLALPPPPPPIFGAGLAILALRPTDCHWPIGDPTKDDFRFCCEPHDPHSRPPYCARHARKAARGGVW